MNEGAPCTFAGCDGVVDGSGYCNSCGRAPARHAASGGHLALPAAHPGGAAPGALDWQTSAPAPGSGGPAGAGTCTFPACDGTVHGGYCNSCGRAPLAPARPALPPATMPPAGLPPAPLAAPGAPGAFAEPAFGAPPSGYAPAPAPFPEPAFGTPSAGASLPTGNGSPSVGGSHATPSGSPSSMTGQGSRGRHSRPRLRPLSSRAGSVGRRGSGSRRGSGAVVSRRTGGTRLGLGLVEVPAVPTGDPLGAVMPVAQVPEESRFCSKCSQPVGRSRNHRPGVLEGFCRQCRTRFSFTPRLGAGDLVGGQYQVLGALTHGGLGWIYLARDRAVSDRWVVLKGLLDAASEEAAMAAVAERRFLAALDHPNIVRIHNFVAHEGAGYIVMEYIGGKSLKAILRDRRQANDPMPVDRAIAYTLGVLPALAYFHAQGLLYCDMKPDNVMLAGDTLKIIDLGGVRHIDDEEAAIYGTVEYQAPEVADLGTTIASDIYTVGRMLAVLLLDSRGSRSAYSHTLPTPDEEPLLAEHESLHRFLVKATAADPIDRFETADDMAEQLLGILREEAAARGEAHPAVSTVFEPGGVVGAGAHDEVGPDWHLLPPPRVDALDPGVGVVLGLGDGEPAAVAATLTEALTTGAVPVTPETLLRLARAQVDAAGADEAVITLDRLGDIRDWRLWWHRGLTALARGRAEEAVDWLDAVYTDLPGEVGAKLALALAHEQAGELVRSAELYDTASRTDPSYVVGGFGLARVRVALGDREGAVDALSRVPAASSAHVAARLAAVRALASTTVPHAGPPTAEQLERASIFLTELRLAPRHHAELAGELFEAGLAALAAGTPTAGRRILGRPLTDHDLRRGLESTYRDIARTATTTRERNDLVDRANRVRPRTLL